MGGDDRKRGRLWILKGQRAPVDARSFAQSTRKEGIRGNYPLQRRRWGPRVRLGGRIEKDLTENYQEKIWELKATEDLRRDG